MERKCSQNTTKQWNCRIESIPLGSFAKPCHGPAFCSAISFYWCCGCCCCLYFALLLPRLFSPHTEDLIVWLGLPFAFTNLTQSITNSHNNSPTPFAITTKNRANNSVMMTATTSEYTLNIHTNTRSTSTKWLQ